MLPDPPYEIKDMGYITPCFLWLGGLGNKGYGLINIPNPDWKHKKMMQAHRYFYEKNVGEISYGLVLDHLCNIKRCVNWDHCEPKTNAKNIQRGTQAKVTIGQVREIRRLYVSEIPNIEKLGKLYNISQATVWQIVSNKTWKE